MDTYDDQLEYLHSIADSLVYVDDEATLKKYKCRQCEKVAVKYNMASCKHVFCEECIRHLFDKTCPSCKTVKIFQVTRNEAFEKGLLNLKVKCQNKSHGCEEIISLQKIQEHGTKCQFTRKMILPKVYKERSQREELVEIKMIIKEISDEVKTIFNGVENLKSQMQTEADKIEEFGQKQLMLEKEIIQKVQAFEEKLSVLSTKTSDNSKQQTESVFADQDIDMEMQECPTFDSDEMLGKYPVFIWTIKSFKYIWDGYKYSNTKAISCSEKFHNKEFGLEFKTWLSSSSNADLLISVHEYKCSSNNCFARKFTLIDQTDRTIKRHVQFIDTPKFSQNPANDMATECFLWNILVPKGLLLNEYNAYVRDDAVIIKISMIPIALMYKTVQVSDSGVHLWRIDNYSKKKQDEINCTRLHITSNSFYTSPQGYRVQAFSLLNGNDTSKSNYLSMYIEFVVGEFDHLLPYPFSGMAKFFLLDQSESSDKQHVCREIHFQYTNESRWTGRHDFVNQDTVEKSVYLKNDSLLFKIMVQIF